MIEMACAENQDDGILRTKSGSGPRPKDVNLQPVRANSESKFEEAHNVSRIVPLAEVEKRAILNALDRLKGNKLLTARALGIGKTTLYRKLRSYGIFDS
jgi:two-component system response regulator HydG